MTHFKGITLLVWVTVFFSCTSQRFQYSDLPQQQLIFGKGGGIAGATDTYTMLENGQVFHHSSLGGIVNELTGIPKKEAATLIAEINALRLSKSSFDHPGNIYYFLEEVNGKERHRVTWGSNTHDVPANYKRFYDKLMTTLK